MHSLVTTEAFLDTLLASGDAGADQAPAPPSVRFTADRARFAAAVERATTVVPTGDAMPVLKNLQIHVTAQRLHIVATDARLSLIIAEACDADTPGTFVIPAKRIADILRESSGEHIHLHVHGANADVAIGRTRWTLRLPGGADFPPMPDLAEAVLTAVDRLALLTALQTVRYAAGKDPAKPALMQIDVAAGRLTAADGLRFQQVSLPLTPGDFTLPTPAADDLIKLLRVTDVTDVQVGHSARHLLFAIGPDVFIAGKLAAPFPDMHALLLRPALENQRLLTATRADLLAAVKRVRINADQQTLAISLVLADGELTVCTRDAHGNDAAETLPADWDHGAHRLTLNHTHFLDMIGACLQRSLQFHVGEDTPTRRAPLLLVNTDTGAAGVIQQMLSDWSTP